MTIPPLESEAQARSLPAVRAAYEAHRPPSITGMNRATLAATLHDARVMTGAFDEHVADWLAHWEPATVAAIAGWVQRAYESGKNSSEEGKADG